jgi:hypothetical protein
VFVRTVLDGAIKVTAATVVKSGKGYAAAKTFWEGHVPANETAESFFTGADANRFEFSFIYDGVGVLAAALKHCFADRCPSIGTEGGVNGTVLMPYIRQVSHEGVAGIAAFEEGSNDPKGRLFDLFIANARAVPFQWDIVARTSASYPNLEVCKSPKIGKGCQLIAAPPGTVKCFASSRTSIEVRWDPATFNGASNGASNEASNELLSGYQVTAVGGGDKVVHVISSEADTRHTFWLNSTNPTVVPELKENIVRLSVSIQRLVYGLDLHSITTFSLFFRCMYSTKVYA